MLKKNDKTPVSDVRREIKKILKRWGWTAGALVKILQTGGAGRGKGSNFERDTCRLLSLWWSNNKRDDLFWRSSQSGGRATQRMKSNKETYGQYGDVTATHPDGYSLLDIFTIELKRGYNKDSFLDIFDKTKTKKNSKKLWETFYDQVLGDSRNAGSLSWMLIWQRDRRLPLVYVHGVIIRQLSKYCPKIKKVEHIKAKVQLKDKKVSIYVFELSIFLKTVKPKQLKELNK